MNIIDVHADVQLIASAIDRAVDPDFRASLSGMSSPYGDGDSAGRICDALAESYSASTLLKKQIRLS
jgi:UDP-N-acetylglucosamine 2-epimerase